MGSVFMISSKCDRCSTEFNPRQVTFDEMPAIQQSLAEMPVVFTMKLGAADPVEYRVLCDGCSRVLTNLAEAAGKVTRKPRGPSKKLGDGEPTEPKAKKQPREKGKGDK